MNTKKAVKILQDQILKIEKSKSESLLFQTRSFIKDFFGEQSEEYEVSRKLTFTIVLNGLSKEQISQAFNQKQEEAIKFLNTCIETLKTKGIKKEPFFKTISETAFWTIFSILLPSLTLIGFFFGELKIDKQNIELQLEIKNLKDSLLFFRNNFTPPIPKSHTADTAKNTIT